MLSPCSILSNNISVVATLRKMLQKQVEDRVQESEREPFEKEKIISKLHKAKLDSEKIKKQLGQLKDILNKRSFIELVPEQFRSFIKSTGNGRPSRGQKIFDDKQNRQMNIQIRNYSSKSLHHASKQSKESSQNQHTLRSKIFKDLQDLKKIQEKQKMLAREINFQKMNRNNGLRIQTEYKRKPIQEILGINETKSVNHQNSRNDTFVTEESLESHLIESVVSKLEDSNIVVPTLLKLNSEQLANCQHETSLFCPLKHEYYSGDIVNGIPNGKGKLFACCNKIPLVISQGVQFYHGGFKNGKFQGYGTLRFKNGTKFIGMFKNGVRHGDGSIYYQGGVQMGKWNQGKLSSKI